MKICILLSSYEGTGSVFQEFDEYQNPGLYVKSHQFESRLITKENAYEQIDRIIEEGFDYIWNFLWGTDDDDNVAGISATEYLESKNVPMLGTSSKYLSMSKLDFKKAFDFAKVKSPKRITLSNEDSMQNFVLNGLNFPLIVKPSNGYGSEFLTSESVCHNMEQLLKQIEILKSKMKWQILIEEFIVGEEMSVMILETKDSVVALTPIIYGFPEQWKETERFLDFDKKFRAIDSGEITFKLFDEDLATVEKIKEDSIKAYLALGVLGSGYARLDFRLKDGEPYFLEINHTPAFFSHIGNTFGDDFVIEATYPGGHESFVDTIISSRIRFDAINRLYENFSGTYDDVIATAFGTSIYSIWARLSEQFSFGGTVLDLGCGTGYIGKIIQQQNDVTLTGIDVCHKMTEFAGNYEKVHVGLIENVILKLNMTYDHIISSGALLFCCKRNFEQIFSVMFDLATVSITLGTEDPTEEYISEFEKSCNCKCFNHIQTIESFPIPSDWRLVYKKREYFWKSPKTGLLVFGIVFRYEKVESFESNRNVSMDECINNNLIIINE